MFKGEKIKFDSTLKHMKQTKGIYHENDVVHDKITGDLTFQPFLGGARYAPTALMPDRCLLGVRRYEYYTDRYFDDLELQFGFPAHRKVARRTYGGSFQNTEVVAYAQDEDDPRLWTLWKIIVTTHLPHVIAIAEKCQYTSIETFSRTSRSSLTQKSMLRFTRTHYEIPLHGIKGTNNWAQETSFDTIVNRCESLPVKEVRRLQTEPHWNVMRDHPIFNPKDSRTAIDALVSDLFRGEFPLEEAHYGDLAMKASAKVNANSVNMLEFLQGMRRPKDLIPKLRNLRKLKGVADNYLTVQFGILPTISDIEEIIGAFKLVQPYMDKNGFKTYTSGHRDAMESNGLSYYLDQYIKLGIEDEDNEFQLLMQKIDSVGALPTFENVWELLPYSFAVDWLIDVGGLLERVDTRLRIARLNIRYATMSRKRRISGTVPSSADLPFVGTVDWVHYHRWVSDQCPVPPLSLNTTFQDFSNWLEAGALIIQRTK